MAKQRQLIYLSTFEYPSRHAHALHALLMARAFHGLLGQDFLFICGRTKGPLAVPHRTPLAHILQLIKFFHLRSVAMSFWLGIFLVRQRAWRSDLIIFTSDLRLAAAVRWLKHLLPFKLVTEVHGKPTHREAAGINASDHVVFVTSGLANSFYKRLPHIEVRSTIIGNAVDISLFSGNSSDLRKQLNIANDALVIGYIGRFRPMQSDKGTRFLVDVLPKLPERAVVLLVGGTSEECEGIRSRAVHIGVEARLRVVGYVPFSQVPKYAATADILAYVPPLPDQFLTEETSPMKLFEYAAARKPIIASDLPTFREALGEGAHFITPGSHEDFVNAVKEILDSNASSVMVERAYERVRDNSWDARARRILALV